jgi:hypothetical protein
MAFLRALRKRWVTRDYARKLPNLLARDYGFSQSYSPRQVRSTIERYGLNSDYSCYAISMFSDRAAFDQYHRDLGEHCNYDAMRAEVAAAHFNGNSHFTMSDMLEAFSDSAHIAGAGDSHGVADGHSHGAGGSGNGH